jgi:hypothetical protein
MNFRNMPRILFMLMIGIWVLPKNMLAQDSIENALMSMQEIMAELASRSEEGTNMDELADQLNDLAENPIHINSASDEDLEKLFWLSEFQVQNIRKYIKSNRGISSIYEIAYIQGFTEKEAKILSPFLLFDIPRKEEPITYETALSDSHHRLLLRSQRVLENQKGFATPEVPDGSGYFKGRPASAYIRYSYQLGSKIFAGLTADKDAGEEFFKGSNKKGFDFYSFYFQVNRLKFVKTLLIGDYRVYFGQGLAVWSGFSFGKSPLVMSSMQRNPGITRYQSSDENNFFRGSAITVNLKPLEITFWVSYHRLDANITGQDTLSGGVTEVSSLQTSGLHTTSSEIADEDAVRSNVLGSNVSLIKSNLRAGITALYYTYSSPLIADLKPYNSYYFRGKSNYNLSCDFRYRTGNLILFGEEASSQNGAVAFLNGVQAYISSRLGFTVISRYYQRNYQAMYGNAFGENSRNNNEAGVFAGVECKLFKYITLSGYADVFRFPWLTYSTDMPSGGHDFLAQINFDPGNRLQMYLQYRNKSKDDNYSNNGDVKNIITTVIQERIRYNLSYAASDGVVLRSRLELSSYKTEFTGTSKGFYLGQDMEFSLPKMPLRFYLRYAIFDTDDYNSRVYAYENDLLYAFSIPAFYDKGSRAYIMAKYSPSKRFDLWLKYGMTQYTNRETVGTGLYEIQGNHKSEIKVQMLIKL